jgi:hypothetical protein
VLSLGAAFPGVVLPEPDPDGNVGVLVECWRVREGQPEVAGVVQHALNESVGAATAALFSGIANATAAALPAGVSAAAAGATAGSRSGPLASMFAGALFGVGGALSGSALAGARAAARDARVGGLLARGLSEEISRIGGSYNEVLIALPGVSLGERSYALVVAMHTDSLFARAVDRGLAYGFGKRRAAFVVRKGSFSAYAPDHRMLLALRRLGGDQQDAAGAWAALQTAHALPLLGYVGRGQYARSELARYTYQGSARCEPTKVRIEFGEAGVGPLAGKVFSLPGCSARASYGALAYENVLARIGVAERAPTSTDPGMESP